MPGRTQIADALLIINNNPVEYVPNTLKFDEGLGEQKVRAAAGGGGSVSQIFANDLESNFGGVTVDLFPTIESIEAIRGWKVNRNQNLIQIVITNADGTLTRTFSQASLPGKYEVELGSETNISLEFMSNPAV